MHTNTRTHTDTDEANDREKGGQQICDDFVATVTARQTTVHFAAVPLPLPHGINKPARHRQTSGNIPSGVEESERERERGIADRQSVNTPPIEQTKHLWVLVLLRQSRPHPV